MNQKNKIQSAKKIIFLAHSAPEDNNCALWLGARLSAAGYEVWSEIINLQGGEYSWNDVNAALQERAVKCLLLVSKATKNNSKVLNTLETALKIEKAINDPEFVIPLVIEEIDLLQDIPIPVARKTTIDLKNWAEGLVAILEKFEKENLPKSKEPSKSLSSWIGAFSNSRKITRAVEEQLQSNWYSMALPEFIHFYEVNETLTGLHEVARIAGDLKIPAREYLRMVVSFSTLEELNAALVPQYSLSYRGSVTLQDFLDGKSNSPPCDSKEAKKIVNSITRKGWDNFARSKGLSPYQQADNQIVWWFPQHLTNDEMISFIKPNLSKGRRQLSGKAKAYHWHFGLKASPSLSNPVRLTISSHVIFTIDGQKPVETKDMHGKRRRACKMWYNSKWRDLYQAAMQFLSPDAEQIAMPLGDNVAAHVSKSPIYLQSPISVNIDALSAEPNTEVIDFEENIDLDDIPALQANQDQAVQKDIAMDDNKSLKEVAK